MPYPDVTQHLTNLHCTKEYEDFWHDSHIQTRLAVTTFAGAQHLLKAEPDDWNHSEVGEVIQYVYGLMYSRLVDNFQTYIVGLVSRIFSEKPEMVPSQSIETKIIFKFGNINDLKNHLVEQAATKYSYMNIVDLDEELSKKFGFRIFSTKIQALRVKRIVEIRNILVHNRGILNQTFIGKVGAKADKLSVKIRVPMPLGTDKYLNFVAAEVDKRAILKFGLKI